MKIRQWTSGVLMRGVLSGVLIMVCAAACATSRSRPIQSEFEDIPVPPGLVYQPSKSFVIESTNAKAARLVYRGRITPDSLRLVTRATLEANGWRHVSTSTTVDHWTVQVYEKAGNSLQVAIYEGLWFTYAAFGAAQTLPMTRTVVGAVEPGTAPTSGGFAGDSVIETGNGTSAMLGEPQSFSQGLPAPSATPSNPKRESAWVRARDSIKSFFNKIFSN